MSRTINSGGVPASGVAGRPLEWLSRSPRSSFALIFALSMALRLAIVPLIPPQLFVAEDRSETGAIASSIARGAGFADPYAVPTGPTAHMPPVYPFLLGLALEAFGPAGARVARWLVGASAYSLLFAMLPWVGGWLGAGRRAGVVGGLMGAVLVPCWWINQIEPLAALAMALLVVAYARRWRIGLGGAASSLALGVAAGAACHLLPSLLPIVLGCAAFELWWSRDGREWRLSVLVLIGLVVAAIPWTLRNDIALGDVYFVRSNLGLELRVGNHDGADADMEVSSRRGTLRHPGTQEREARAVRDLGEAAYMRQAKAEALDWIRAHPAAFLGLTARRFGYFWFGRPGVPTEFAFYIALTLLALAGAWRILPTADWPTRAAILVVPITFPVIYYVVAYMPRYREPIDWLLLLLAGAAVSRRPVGE